MDVGLLRSRLDLLLRNLLGRDVRAQGDVEADRAGVQRRLLLNEGDRPAVRLDVQGRDVLTVDDDPSGDGVAGVGGDVSPESERRSEAMPDVLEPLDELDRRALAAAGRAAECDKLTRLDLEPKIQNQHNALVQEVPKSRLTSKSRPRRTGTFRRVGYRKCTFSKRM